MSTIKPQTPTKQRSAAYRSEAYRRHVAKQPCLACGWAQPNDEGYLTQAAHIRTGFHGIADKPDDWYVIPLCAENGWACHTEFGKGEEAFASSSLGMSINELKRRAHLSWKEWENEND